MDKRVIILYLSSAARNQAIFSLPQIRLAATEIEGAQYSFGWRTRTQAFADLVTRTTEVADSSDNNEHGEIEPLEQIRRSIESLKQARERIEHTSSSECENCILRGGSSTDCAYLDFCQGIEVVDAAVRDTRTKVDNLGLLATVRKHWQFSVVRTNSGKYEELLDAYNLACSDVGIKDVALRQLETLQSLIMAQSEFNRGVSTVVSNESARRYLKDDRDIITSRAIFLPMYPVFESQRYIDMAAKIVEYYRTPYTERAKMWQLFTAVYGDFAAAEGKQTELNGDHELVRCLLYLAFPDRKGDELALNHARSMKRRLPKTRREFCYVAAWAARRAKQFREGYNLASESIKQYPEDPRFWHGRALLNLAWYKDETLGDSWDLGGDEAVSDIEKALELYREDLPRFEAAYGAAYCNLAYMKCIDNGDWQAFDIVGARRSIERLKGLSDIDSWPSDFPEYLHAEASVLFPVGRGLGTQGDFEEAMQRLVAAKEHNDQAIQGYPSKSMFGVLGGRIDSEIDTIKRRSAK